MIGVYGGTFDPVHYGHLRTALEVKEIFSLQQLHLVPCKLPPHRQVPSVSAEMRLQMLQLAVADCQGVIVDRRELDREGPSYMVDTLQSLKNEYAAYAIVLFIGNDAFAKLHTWHRWQQLFEYAHVVVMTRPGYHVGELGDFYNLCVVDELEQLQESECGRVYFHEVTQLDISSTQIRKIFKQGKDPRFLVPDPVISYINTYQLYQNKTGN